MRPYLIFLIPLLIVQGANAAPNQGSYCAMPQSASYATPTSDISLPPSQLQPVDNSLKPNWATRLGWTYSSNLCGGYFYEPPAITAVPRPAPMGTTLTSITFTGKATFSESQPSTVEGNVILTQPGREIAADKAILYRNNQTGKIDSVDLEGNVRYRQAGRLMVGNFSHIDLKDSTLSLSKGAYQIIRPSLGGPLYGWGVIGKGYKNAQDVVFLENSSYTTCAPTGTPVWNLKAKKLTLNKNTGRGVARDAWLYAGGVPLFYTPYANFPIDRRRYSGFLYPTYGYNKDSGFMVGIPYYFNLAPNYDETLTVTPMTKRGVEMTSYARYLTETSTGYLGLDFLPDDREFANFRATAPQIYPANPYNQPFLDQLADDSNNRGAFAFKDTTEFNQNWSGLVDLNYVTDAYYFQDFGNTPQMVNNDQLLNQALLKYQDTHWRFQSQVQGYQTLHQIDQTFVSDQYRRLPQFDLSGSFPNQAYGLDFEVNSEWTNFQHAADFFSGEPYPTGYRTHLNPQLSLPVIRSAGFFNPALGVDITNYSVINDAIVNTTVSPPFFYPTTSSNLNTTRALPIFDIDSGLYFERDFHLGSYGYRQTLEPRAFYLWVPPTDQNDIPLFDTTLPTFGIDQLFRNNRFIGYDRVGDANQLSLGLTSRVLDGFSGAEKLNATIGQIYYFRKHTVCLYPDCSDDPTIGDQVSPIAGQLTFNPNPKWSLTGSAAYDPTESVMNNEALTLQYNPGPQRLIKVGYNFVQNGDVLTATNTSSSENNLQRLDFGVAWPIRENWNILADWNYNISHRQPQAYMYGVEYNNCCVAIRLVSSRISNGQNVNGGTSYTSNVYLQILLKGLGTVGSNGASDLIKTTLPGYIDYFKG